MRAGDGLQQFLQGDGLRLRQPARRLYRRAGGQGQNGALPKCGASFEEITESGKIGCMECYRVFHDRLLPTIHRIHGTAKHKGKIPGTAALRIVEPAGKIAVVETSPLDKKRAELKAAIEKQDFERAAVLRDEIREMEKGEQSNG